MSWAGQLMLLTSNIYWIDLVLDTSRTCFVLYSHISQFILVEKLLKVYILNMVGWFISFKNDKYSRDFLEIVIIVIDSLSSPWLIFTKQQITRWDKIDLVGDSSRAEGRLRLFIQGWQHARCLTKEDKLLPQKAHSLDRHTKGWQWKGREQCQGKRGSKS